MGRLLAIDYGTKRTGIAITDELQIIASGLTTVATEQLIPFLKNYCSKEKVDLFIVGKPKQLNNKDSESEVFIKPFLEKLTKEKNIEVQIVLAYNYEMAKKAMLEEAKLVLQAETEDVRQKYEKYLNPENFNRGDIKNTNQE